MFIENIANAVAGYHLGNKIDVDGFVTNEKNPNFKIVMPPKKKNQYASEEEFNKAQAEYQSFQNEVSKYKEAVKKMVKLTLEQPEDKLYSKNQIKNAIVRDNKLRKENGLNDELVREDVSLSSSEKKQRKEIHNEAVEILSDKISLQIIGNELVKNYSYAMGHGQPSRPTMDLFVAGVSSLDDLYKDYNILVNGSPEAKAQMFKNKMQKAKECSYFLCEQKEPKEYIEFFKDNFLTVNVMPEMQLDNMENIQEVWGFKIDNKTYNEIKEDYNPYVSIGGCSRILGKMANPYYPIVRESCHNGDNKINDDDSEITELVDQEGFHVARDIDAIKEGDPLAKVFHDYLADQDFGKEGKPHLEDTMYFYFKKNMGNLNKIKDEQGNVTEGSPKELANAAAKLLRENKTFLVYDELGNFKTKCNIPDEHMNDIPQTYGKLKNINFKYQNTPEQIQKLKKEFGKLDGYFSKDHQEYKDMKTFIDGMGDAYKKGTSLSTLCSKLRELAVNYVESKYTKDTPDKTARTYQREEFMCRLIATIDDKYPIHYPVNIQKKTIGGENLDKADLKNDKILNDIIKMNKEGYSREEVETHVENMLYEDSKTQVEINLGEDKKDNVKEVFPDLNEKQPQQQKEVEEEVFHKEGMSEKDN